MTYTPDYLNAYIGKRVKMRRRLIGMTQRELAAACDLSNAQQINKYEYGKNAIAAARLWQIARALRVPIEYFYEGLEEQCSCALESQAALH